jgi:hypothetical protein
MADGVKLMDWPDRACGRVAQVVDIKQIGPMARKVL